MSFTRQLYIFMVCLGSCLLFSGLSIAQDYSNASRFEMGGTFTAIRGASLGGDVGPGISGNINFGNHIALDGTFNWLPLSFSQTVNGFFGPKIGMRTTRFGFFAKARPGFFSGAHVFRESTVDLTSSQVSTRFARLTERAVDLGGVLEYYPARHWLLRWDMGDVLMFEEPTKFNVIGGGFPPTSSFNPGTTNHFTVSTGVHYRF